LETTEKRELIKNPLMDVSGFLFHLPFSAQNLPENAAGDGGLSLASYPILPVI
jgi:hypothetical protein